MKTRTLNILSLCAVLVGCGGAEFSSVAGADDGGDVTSQSDSGVTLDAAGGSQSTGGAATGGRPASTGGAPWGGAATGSGGGPGSTGGGPAVTGGAAGTGGVTSGSGGAGSTCRPPVVSDVNLPSTVVWQTYLGKYGDTCLSCTNAPCTTCQITWWPVTQSADGLTVTATVNKIECAPVGVALAPCGTSVVGSLPCTNWSSSFGGTATFALAAKKDGTGYHVADVTGLVFDIFAPQGSCDPGATGVYHSAFTSVRPGDSEAESYLPQLRAAEWPCG